ncbi:hypothetical protein ACFY2W_36345 [Streptomyces sp. NPDC001262]|uniref:hypothetical protein n=1 Tax=Streptomyces sp. NPDC001262 TaxID=3364552 RepID=UPI0036A7AC18
MAMDSPLCAYLYAVEQALEADGVWTDVWRAAARHHDGVRQHIGIIEWSSTNRANTRPWPGGLTFARFPDRWVYTDVPYSGVPERHQALPLDPWAEPGTVALLARHLLVHGPEAIPSPASNCGWSGAETAQAALDRLARDPDGTDIFFP